MDKKTPKREQMDLFYLENKIKMLEKTIKFQYWFLAGIFILGLLIQAIITSIIGK